MGDLMKQSKKKMSVRPPSVTVYLRDDEIKWLEGKRRVALESGSSIIAAIVRREIAREKKRNA